ncbi:UNVERIFIED_CONTAM: hypothetical protein NCL1_26162 [Trichonephila clavipes]
MCSVTKTGTCCLPLCTAIVRPTISGRIIERRDQVLMGFFELAAAAASTLTNRWVSTNGPFFSERGTVILLYPLLDATVANNHLSRTLVGTCLVPFSFLTPWTYRLNTFTTSFTTTVRMVDRVHGHATNGRTHTAPAAGASLAQGAQVVLAVRDFAEDGAALDMDLAHFAGAQTHDGVGAITTQQLHRGTGGAGQLGALARLQLDAAQGGTERHVAQRQHIAVPDRRGIARQDHITDLLVLQRDHVAALAIGVLQQRDVGSAVRIVLDALDGGRNAILVALEVDHAIQLLVAATDVTHGDAAIVVTTTGALLGLDQRGVRTTLVQVRMNDLLDEATTRGSRFALNDRHVRSPGPYSAAPAAAKSMSKPSFRET